MRRAVINWLLLIAGVALVTLNWTMRVDPSRRNWEVLPEMARSIPYDAFSTNPNFRDGKTLREPVRGTVVHGVLPLHYASTPEDAARAGRELVNPFRLGDARELARGVTVFANFCQACHGPSGGGDGLMAQRGFPAPPSLLAPHARSLPDGRIFHIITYGQGNMPSHAAQVERVDRWRAALFIRDLQRRQR